MGILSLLIAFALISPTHLQAAQVAGAEYKLDPLLLLAIADHETHHDESLVNRDAGLHCGPMQVRAMTQEECDGMLEVSAGYRAGAKGLRWWLGFARGDMRRALRGYARGFAIDPETKKPFRPLRVADTCNGFDSYVLTLRARWVREAAAAARAPVI